MFSPSTLQFQQLLACCSCTYKVLGSARMLSSESHTAVHYLVGCPAIVMMAHAGLVRSLTAIAAEAPDAATQAEQFIAAFTAQYGDTHPAWVATSWREAAAAAHAEFKFLLVYLHSPEHENTEAYVRNVLCSPEVVEYANSHFVSWAGNVQRPDAFNLAGRLNVSTYPCVALLAFSGTRTKLVVAAQGNVQPQQLLAALRRAVEEQEVMLTAERLEQEERVSTSRGRGQAFAAVALQQQQSTGAQVAEALQQQAVEHRCNSSQ
jgi:FAS-associated factor 2